MREKGGLVSSVGKTNINTYRVSELNNQNVKCIKVETKNSNKLVEKYRTMFKDRDASLIKLYFVVLGIRIPKNQINQKILSHTIMSLKSF